MYEWICRLNEFYKLSKKNRLYNSLKEMSMIKINGIFKCKNTFSYFLTFPVNNSIVNLLECFKCKYISKFDHKKVNVKK